MKRGRIIRLPQENMIEKQLTVAGIYPHAKGFGYAIFRGREISIIHGNAFVSPVNNKRTLGRIRHILEKNKPDVIVLRDESAKKFRGSQRTAELLQDIRRLAQDLDIQVFDFSRKNIRAAFEQYGVSTKNGIATKICEWIPILSDRLPPKRKNKGEGQYFQQGLFDAISLVHTFVHFSR